MDYIWLALTAFGGLGLEALFAFVLEPMVYCKICKEKSRI